ncbi:hypothetical protein ACPESR_21165 [Nocardia testacea]|uniref:hypothetical protein n=1 Tax=Nocardia testacea TaxID=248551 RepID=UPI003C2FEF02
MGIQIHAQFTQSQVYQGPALGGEPVDQLLARTHGVVEPMQHLGGEGAALTAAPSELPMG